MKYIIIITVILLIYIIVVGGRFWFYYNRAQQLMKNTTKTDYVLKGGTKQKLVYVLGDSTAAGTGARSVEETYHYQYLNKHTDKFTFDVKNRGVVGARTADIANQLKSFDHADLILLTVGGNDITHGTSWDLVERDLKNSLIEANKKASHVIYLTPGSFRDVFIVPYPIRLFWGRRSPILSTLAARLSKETKTTHVDIFARNSPLFREEPETYYASDLFHPSKEGYALWADAIDQTFTLD